MFDGTEIYTSGYADDTSIFVIGKNTEKMRTLLQKGLDMAQDWATKHSLEFGLDKTKTIIFHRYAAKTFKEPRPVCLYGQAIPFTSEIKHLGVYMDYRLYWKAHINTKINLNILIIN